MTFFKAEPLGVCGFPCLHLSLESKLNCRVSLPAIFLPVILWIVTAKSLLFETESLTLPEESVAGGHFRGRGLSG
jgi:hypothetical protein